MRFTMIFDLQRFAGEPVDFYESIYLNVRMNNTTYKIPFYFAPSSSGVRLKTWDNGRAYYSGIMLEGEPQYTNVLCTRQNGKTYYLLSDKSQSKTTTPNSPLPDEDTELEILNNEYNTGGAYLLRVNASGAPSMDKFLRDALVHAPSYGYSLNFIEYDFFTPAGVWEAFCTEYYNSPHFNPPADLSNEEFAGTEWYVVMADNFPTECQIKGPWGYYRSDYQYMFLPYDQYEPPTLLAPKRRISSQFSSTSFIFEIPCMGYIRYVAPNLPAIKDPD